MAAAEVTGVDQEMMLITVGRVPSRPMARGSSGVRWSSGFTLIELMTVVAIVAILVAVALPSYNEAVRKGRRGQAKADLVELAQVLERYRTVNNTYVTPAAWLNPISKSPRLGTADYTIAITGQTASAFKIAATPVAGLDQANDRCGVLALNQAGSKFHSIGTDDQCQFGTTGSPP